MKDESLFAEFVLPIVVHFKYRFKLQRASSRGKISKSSSFLTVGQLLFLL